MKVPGLVVNNPISIDRIDALLGRLELTPTDTVVDVGCGNGEILGRVIDRFGCFAIGVDPDGAALDQARHRLAPHGDAVRLHEAPIQEVDLADEEIRTALCIGATHACGSPQDGYLHTLIAFRELLEPGGLMLVGEGYWKQDPDPRYLKATCMGRHDYFTHAGNVEVAEAEGLAVLSATVSTEQEWDSFEGLFWSAAEEQLRQNPNDPAAQKKAEHWRDWRRAYLAWGRDTLGFGLYLFRTPDS